MRRILGIGLVVACGVALVVGGIGPAAGQSVSPASFTKQVCLAVATADQSGDAVSASLKAAVQAYKSAPSATTAVALRDALTQAAQNVEQQIAAVLTAVQQTGTPARATSFVSALTTELEAQRAAAKQLAQHASAIDTTSATAFAAGVQQVVAATKTYAAQARASAKKNAAFKHAARPLRPIVHFMTTSADRCGKV